MEDDDLVPPGHEMADTVDGRLDRAVAIADEHDHAAAIQPLADQFERGAEIALSLAGEIFELRQDREQVPLALLGGQKIPHVGVERHKPGGILLVRGEVAQGRGEIRAVFELGEPALVLRHVAHAAARVEQADDVHVRFHLEPLHVIPLGAGEHLPVDRPQLVAAGVFTVIDELHAVAVVGRAVAGGIHSLHEQPRLQLDPGDRSQEFGVEEANGGRGFHRGRLSCLSGWYRTRVPRVRSLLTRS